MLKRFIPVMLALPFLTGCASSGLVHDKDYLRAVSVSGTENKQVTFSFFSDGIDTVYAEGEGLEQALENAELITGRPIFTGYTELVILDGSDSEETLEHLLRDWKISPDCTVTYSKNGRELLEENPAEVLTGQVRQAEKQGLVLESGIITVLGELLR